MRKKDLFLQLVSAFETAKVESPVDAAFAKFSELQALETIEQQQLAIALVLKGKSLADSATIVKVVAPKVTK